MSGEVQQTVPKSVKHRLLKLAHLLVSFGVGICIVLGIGVWRLSQGPVSLDYLTPALERSLSARGASLAVHVDKTVLIWGGWQRFADIRLYDLRLLGPDGKLVARIPELSVGISLQALLQRRLSLSRVEVYRLTATVERFADGRFGFALPISGDDAAAGGTALHDATDTVMQLVRSGDGPLRDLRRFALLDARLRYIDRARDAVWDFPQASFAADLRPPGIEATLALLLERQGERTQLSGSVLHDRRSGRTSGRIIFDDLRPNLLARAAPALGEISQLGVSVSGNAQFEIGENLSLSALRLDLRSPVGGALIELAYPADGGAINAVATLRGLNVAAIARSTPALAQLAGLDLPLSGHVVGRITGKAQVNVTEVDLRAAAGQIDLPGILDEKLAVSGARLRAVIAPDLTKAEIHEAKIEIGEARLTATANLRRARDAYRLRSAFQFDGLSARDLERYWPSRLAPTARRWVRRNIAAGVIRKGSGDIVLRIPRSAPTEFAVESIDGSFSYEGLHVRYWSPLPAATDVGGTAIFDRRMLRFSVTEGHLRDVAIEQGSIQITGLDRGERKVDIELGLRGAARTIVQVLDHEPLRYAAHIGIRPDAVSGDAIIRSRIAFQLGDEISSDAIAFKVSAKVRNVGLKPAPYGLAVEGGEIAIDADRGNIKMAGHVQLGALPVSIEWTEQLDAGANSRRVRLAGRIRDFGRIGFGLPEFDFVEGPGDSSIVIRTLSDSSSEVVAYFDLTEAALSVPYLGWQKSAPSPGRATIRMRVGGAGDFAIEEFRVETGDTRLEGAAAPTKHGSWHIRIDRFERPQSHVAGSVELRQDRTLVANIRGDRFDITPVLTAAPLVTNRLNRPSMPPRRLKVNAQIKTLAWGPDRRIRDALLSLSRGPQGIEGLMLEGDTGRRSHVSVKYLPVPDGLVLEVRANDFGRALGIVMPAGNVVGGSMIIRGHAAAPGPPLQGTFQARNFVVREAPTFARLLQAASLTGVADALSEKGLRFDAFEGEFLYAAGRLSFANTKAHGSSIGLTLSGDIAADAGRLALGGTLVPAYTFNRAIGELPLVGPLLSGGKNEGLFAATYRVTGPIAEPEVRVNPLSVLTPGFLRNLFSGAVAELPGGSDGKRRKAAD